MSNSRIRGTAMGRGALPIGERGIVRDCPAKRRRHVGMRDAKFIEVLSVGLE
jgi:hypothetical protein